MKRPASYQHQKVVKEEPEVAQHQDLIWGQGDEEHFLFYAMPIMFDRDMRENYLMECGSPDAGNKCDLETALAHYQGYIDFRCYDFNENKLRLRQVAQFVQAKPPRLFVTNHPLLQRTIGKRPVAIYDRSVPWYNSKKNIRWTIFKSSHKRPILLFEGETLSQFLKQELDECATGV